MHASSYRKMELFAETYLSGATDLPLDVLDFGSQQVNPLSLTYRTIFDRSPWNYRGLDIEAGHNVDVAVSNAYDWSEVPSNSVDVVVSGQAFEHVEYFWASAFEIGRVLRPGGLLMLIAPSGGYEHRFPVDCWRFYRDGFSALGRYLGFEEIDAYTDWGNEAWEDSVLVVRKPIMTAEEHRTFERRAAMQRALVSPEAALPDEPQLDDLPATSVIAQPTPGALTERLQQRSPADRVKGRMMWAGERLAGVKGRELAGKARKIVTRR